jgi:paraquat-inducible protein A
MKQKTWLWLLLIASIVLMVQGWLLPILTLKIAIDVPIIGEYNLFNETRSIMGTMTHLFEIGKWLPALLILLFGMLLPVAKTLGIAWALLAPPQKAQGIANATQMVSKWAMADVFAISIIVAFLAMNGMSNTEAILHSGFYVFTAYVLLSALNAFWVNRLLEKEATKNP